MKEKTITVDGFEVSVCDFGYRKYFYPCFNTDAEFEVSKRGFKKLRRYLRYVKWVESKFPIMDLGIGPLTLLSILPTR